MNYLDVGQIFVGVFCAGGLFAYGRETLRLRRLMSSGLTAPATVLRKQKIDAGSESVVHFLVTYEFVDDRRNPVIHEQDLNNRKLFDSLSPGDKIEVLYMSGGADSSYPTSQIRADLRLSQWICAGLVVLWGVMSGVLLWRGG